MTPVESRHPAFREPWNPQRTLAWLPPVLDSTATADMSGAHSSVRHIFTDAREPPKSHPITPAVPSAREAMARRQSVMSNGVRSPSKVGH
jgi:hypothetical protein